LKPLWKFSWVLGRKFFSTFEATALNGVSAIVCRHAIAKPVLAGLFNFFWLVGSFGHEGCLRFNIVYCTLGLLVEQIRTKEEEFQVFGMWIVCSIIEIYRVCFWVNWGFSFLWKSGYNQYK